jgi:hypothetical protein
LPSFVPHLIAPVLVALAFFPMARRQILMWAPMVWVPDLDYFVAQDYHRALFGNIWIPLALAGSLVWLWRRRDPASAFWEFALRPGAPGGLFLTTYFFAGHLLMDLFVGGVPIFWPLSDVSPYIGYAIFVYTQTGQVETVQEAGAPENIPEVSPIFPWLDYDHTAQLAFLAAMVLGWLAYLGVRNWRGYKAPVLVWREASIQKR